MAFSRFRRGGALSPVLSSDGYRSGLERRVAAQLAAAGVPYEYEKHKLAYTVPARDAKYTPDFILNGKLIIESKGLFVAQDRQKMVLVKEAHPELDIRLVFQRAASPLYKGSKTTYAAWADAHGFLWADHGRIPETWLKEAISP